MKTMNKARITFLLIFLVLLVFLLSASITSQEENNIPVSIDKAGTKFEYGIHYINESVKLTVAIKNEGENDTEVTLRVTGDNLIIHEEGNQSFIVKSGWSSSKYDFFITANQTGNYLVKIELFYDGNFEYYQLPIEFEEEINLPPTMIMVFWIYTIACFFVYLIFVRRIFTFIDERSWIALLLLFGFIFFMIYNNYYSQLPETIVTSHFEKVAPLLGLIIILVVSMAITLVFNLKRYSLIIATVTIYSITFTLFVDFFIPREFSTLFTIITYISSLILGIILGIIGKKIATE